MDGFVKKVEEGAGESSLIFYIIIIRIFSTSFIESMISVSKLSSLAFSTTILLNSYSFEEITITVLRLGVHIFKPLNLWSISAILTLALLPTLIILKTSMTNVFSFPSTKKSTFISFPVGSCKVEWT
jgi:hypothetical protein